MKAPAKHHATTPALNLTPMIDVVFLLIIFFIVSSSLIRQENSLEMELPTAVTGKLLEEEQGMGRKLTINVPSEEELLVGTWPVDQQSLLKVLEQQIDQSRASTGDMIDVRIRMNRTVPWHCIAPILRNCAKCGIRDVSFHVVETRK